MSRCTKVLAVLIALASVRGFALTPPIEPADLLHQADLIVKGEVTDIQCAPQGYEQNRCATWDWYLATLQVNTVKKGKWPGRTLPILFRDVHFVKGCVGDSDHIHHLGERGFYYLVSRGDGNWALVNWSAVDVKRRGEGPLPLCR